MRGQPLWQVLLIVAAFLAAGIPVWRLTRPANAAAAIVIPPEALPSAPANAGTDAAPKLMPLEVSVQFTHAPTDFQLSYLGKPILSGHDPQSRAAGQWSVQIPKEGIDLALQANWPTLPENTEAAARVTVHFPDGRQIEKSFWSTGGAPLAELVTVLPNP